MHLFIHGGYWHRFSKNEFSFVARAFQPAGAAVVVISYALIPTADMDELVRQCRAAVAWVYRNAGLPADVSCLRARHGRQAPPALEEALALVLGVSG